MQYPLISEYIEAIRSAEDNFDKLINLRPVLDDNGNPIMSSGNFAVVFKMKDVLTDRLFAVKCFIKDQEERGERYSKITEELEYVSSSYILHVRYLKRELFVNAAGCNVKEFPVLVMDWVEGQPLDAYLRQHINDKYELQMLAYRFCKMGAWLLSQSFAHGDIKPDNILVREDGTLVLVDYDGMFVPSLEGEKANEMGSPDFQHPLRTEQDFDEHIDDFSIASIALSLKAIALNPLLYNQYGTADRLLFSAADYRDIGSSISLQTIVKLSSESELSILLGIFFLSLAKNSLSSVSFRLLLLHEPEKPAIEVLSTKITDEERKNAIIDAYGAKYTADGLKLIELPNVWTREYRIKEGTKVIGDNAFSHFFPISITIPDSVKRIGDGAFYGCYTLTSLTIPDRVTNIGDYVFSWCSSLTTITIPNSVTSIGNNAFSYCESLTSITIPDSVTSIGNHAFSGCSSLTSITIPDIVTSIGNYVFSGCSSLISITIPDIVTSIGDHAFMGCSSLISITIPDSVTSIGEHAFSRCSSLTSITIPDSVTSIGFGTFCACSSLTSIIIPNSVTSIGSWAFDSCSSLTSITIPDSVTSIGDYAFVNCSSLISITIPDSVTSIGDGAFYGCESLISITIPDSVTSIGDGAFYGCSSLTSITIPDSLTSIGNNALSECSSLTSITIPDSVTSIGERAFWYCESLTSITIPNSVTCIGGCIFNDCKELHNVILETSNFFVQDNILYSKEGRVISCWSGNSHIIIPQGVTSIGNNAFSWCYSLTTITIPNSVTSIEESAFDGCKFLNSITIPNSVTSIGKRAFDGCESLNSIRIPKGTRKRMLKLLGDWSIEKLLEI